MSSPAQPAAPSRRNFLKQASLTGLVALSAPAELLAAKEKPKAKQIALVPNDIILFQGDSITDAGRKREPKDAAVPNTPQTLGTGYPHLAAAQLLLRQPEKQLSFYNRGVSGNKTYQLAERWDADCLDLKPNILSILVGVNDFWHTLLSGYTGTVQKYTADYQALLERTRERLPDVKLIIGEPFAVPGVKAVDEKWFPAFKDYQAGARSIAEKFNATLIPYQSVFDQALKKAPGAYWTRDGVHPTVAGNELMAQAWLSTIKQ
jgi:lysophospholipase L1-like esterase